MLTIDEGSELCEFLEGEVVCLGCDPLDTVRVTVGRFISDGVSKSSTALDIRCGFERPGFKCAFCVDSVARDVGRWLRERFDP